MMIIIIITIITDTYAESHIGNTTTKPGAAAQKAAQNMNDKYAR